jgi:hypothetical protein
MHACLATQNSLQKPDNLLFGFGFKTPSISPHLLLLFLLYFFDFLFHRLLTTFSMFVSDTLLPGFILITEQDFAPGGGFSARRAARVGAALHVRPLR